MLLERLGGSGRSELRVVELVFVLSGRCSMFVKYVFLCFGFEWVRNRSIGFLFVENFFRLVDWCKRRVC